MILQDKVEVSTRAIIPPVLSALTSCIHHRTVQARVVAQTPCRHLNSIAASSATPGTPNADLSLDQWCAHSLFRASNIFFHLRRGLPHFRRHVKENTLSAYFFSHTVFLTLSWHKTGSMPFAFLGPQLPLVCSWELRGRGERPCDLEQRLSWLGGFVPTWCRTPSIRNA